MCLKMCCIRTLQALVILISVSWNLAQHDSDHTPAIGIKGTKCYDDFNRPQISEGYGNTNFVVKRFEMCDPNVHYPLTFNSTFKMVQHQQYASGDFLFDVEIGSNIKSNFSIESQVGSHYVYLFSITADNLCTALHKYLGEFIYEIERNAQMIPKKCPIPKGVYHTHNVELDFNKITLQTFPFGHLRFTEHAYDRQNNLMTCLIIEVDNHE